MPEQGTCPVISQMQDLSQATPKFAGLSFFSLAIVSISRTFLAMKEKMSGNRGECCDRLTLIYPRRSPSDLICLPWICCVRL